LTGWKLDEPLSPLSSALRQKKTPVLGLERLTSGEVGLFENCTNRLFDHLVDAGKVGQTASAAVSLQPL
jgi:hypothetical protein